MLIRFLPFPREWWFYPEQVGISGCSIGRKKILILVSDTKKALEVQGQDSLGQASYMA